MDDGNMARAPRPAADPLQAVREALAPYWLSTRQVAARAGIPEATALKALHQLKAGGQAQTPRGTYLGQLWRAAPSPPPAQSLHHSS